MLEVKKMRTLSRRGSEMDEGVVMDKTNKYLVSESAQEGDKCSASAGGGVLRGICRLGPLAQQTDKTMVMTNVWVSRT